MKPQKESLHCDNCHQQTQHVVVLVRKESPYKNHPKRKLKEFLSGFFKGWFLGAFVASMDEFERHIICEVCGTKVIED